MNNYEPIERLSPEFEPWGARLIKATPTDIGVFRLVSIRKTESKGFEEQRVIVLVLDENGIAMPNIPVVFAYSTGPHPIPYLNWYAPYPPLKALVVATQGSGQIDQIQGSAVKPDEPGGITVYIGDPKISSDAVSGAGMLQDHSGLHLTFKLYRTGVKSLTDRVSDLEQRIGILESNVLQLTESP